MNLISSRDISVIVQGAIDPNATYICLKSIRKILPESTIILSTWKGEQVGGLEYDKLIFNHDVPVYPYEYKSNSKLNNVNRQITTTLAGLKQCKTRYALKLRSDFMLTSTRFLEEYNNYSQRNTEYIFFNHKILTCIWFCRKFSCFPYHPSDLFQFGQTDDLLKLWNIPLMKRKEAFWLSRSFNPKFYLINRYLPEQWIWIQALRKQGITVPYDSIYDIKKEFQADSEQWLINNFIALNYQRSGIVPLKSSLKRLSSTDRDSCYSMAEFLNLYKTYCVPQYTIPLELYLERDVAKLIKHFLKFCHPFYTLYLSILKITSPFFKWIEEFFNVIGYLLKIIVKSVYYAFTKKY